MLFNVKELRYKSKEERKNYILSILDQLDDYYYYYYTYNKRLTKYDCISQIKEPRVKEIIVKIIMEYLPKKE